ncbi:shikimate O-hydroxycinnamoyltransferase-like [Lycium barbarum]|uniref:shikimate O-hydroxycinnamoyltransferase-like n=1 Tax=Lycium barbarum TaxID=112863 RepID=UPI00293E4567|nr:shikimate O-hydroxycinnamoyltransferase-like [Lycium barbarum]
MAPYEALYGRKCRSPTGWFEVGEANLFGPDLVHQAIEKQPTCQSHSSTKSTSQFINTSNSSKYFYIHDALARMNDEYLRSAIDYLELMTDLSKLIRGPTYFASPNLNSNSWTKLPVHDSDFGWGKPIHMGPACILYEGTVYILPSSNDDKNLRLAVCLDADHMGLFGKYLYDF